jgi:glycosyltransferase involved in cell wall biosynthesis
MVTPLVSVVMSVYNSEKYLKESIESILNQTYKEFEFIIINDGSTDSSLEIIKSYIDNRIIIIDQNNTGLAKALNNGIAKAKGKYIARMDADDISVITRLEKQLIFMESNLEIGLCGTWIQCFGNSQKVIKNFSENNQILTKLLFDSAIAHPTFLFRKSIIDSLCLTYSGGTGESYFCEDYDFLVNLIGHTQFANIPEVLLLYRVHSASISSVNSFENRRKGRETVQKRAFKKILNYNISKNELVIHHNFSFYAPIKSNSEILEIENWLLKVISRANEVKFVFEKEVIVLRLKVMIKSFALKYKFISILLTSISWMKIIRQLKRNHNY